MFGTCRGERPVVRSSEADRLPGCGSAVRKPLDRDHPLAAPDHHVRRGCSDGSTELDDEHGVPQWRVSERFHSSHVGVEAAPAAVAGPKHSSGPVPLDIGTARLGIGGDRRSGERAADGELAISQPDTSALRVELIHLPRVGTEGVSAKLRSPQRRRSDRADDQPAAAISGLFARTRISWVQARSTG